MTYWRMQLHPDDRSRAIHRTVECLSAGYIGLDFDVPIGDMTLLRTDALPPRHRHYHAFCSKMAVGDRVLLFAHHFPCALVRVAGPYNYIAAEVPELGFWFRHFRAVDDIRYFGDWCPNATKWPRLVMTSAIAPLRTPRSASFRLIEEWIANSSRPAMSRPSPSVVAQ